MVLGGSSLSFLLSFFLKKKIYKKSTREVKETEEGRDGSEKSQDAPGGLGGERRGGVRGAGWVGFK